MKRNADPTPFIFQLLSRLGSDRVVENDVTPIPAKTMVLLMALAGIGAFLFGVFSGVVPCSCTNL